MPYDDEERKTSSELEQSAKSLHNKSKEFRDNYKNEKKKINDNKEINKTPRHNKADPNAGIPKENKLGKNDVIQAGKSPTPNSKAAQALKRAKESNAGKIASGAASKAKTVAKAAGKSAVKTSGAPAIALIFLFLMIAGFLCNPMLILKALVYDGVRCIIGGFYEIRCEVFGYDDFCDLPKEEQEKIIEEKTNEFFGTCGRKASAVTHGFYSFFSVVDNWTDDDSLIGGFVDTAADKCFEATVSLDIAVDEFLDGDYDAESFVPLLVQQRLRDYFSDTSNYISLEQMQVKGEELEDKLLDIYTTPYGEEAEAREGSATDPRMLLDFYGQCSGNDDYVTNLPATKVPIIIEGEENFLSMNGELMGDTTTKPGYQILDNCPIYNPSGNRRLGMSMSLGSNYELYTQSAYLIAVYSASHPYSSQSTAGLLTSVESGLRKYFNQNEMTYEAKVTEVYMGALVPRFYEPVVYKNADGQYAAGNYEAGYFASRTSSAAGTLGADNREVLGMRTNPDLEAAGYKQVPWNEVVGWFDLNGNAIVDPDEYFPIVMQTLGEPDSEAQKILPSSFCVLSSDPRYCNINYDKSNTRYVEGEDAGTGYYIFGTENLKTCPYAKDWQEDFEYQYERQTYIYEKLSDEEKAKYLFRYQMPFTRVSFLQGDDFPYDYNQFTPVSSTQDYELLGHMGNQMPDGSVEYLNGGVLNGYYAWVYLKPYQQAQMKIWDDREQTKLFDPCGELTPDNWSHYEGYTPTKEDGYEANNYIYHTTMRYFFSVDVTTSSDFLVNMGNIIGYDPMADTPSDPDDELSTERYKTGKRAVKETQGIYAMSVYENYLNLMGVEPEVITMVNPQVGSEKQYSYNEMLVIVRNLTNADGTPVTDMNTKYLCYIAIASAGHMLYELGRYDLPNEIDFDLWLQPTDNANSIANSKYPPTIGTDCTGFVSWCYMTAFGEDVLGGRFDTRSALNITGGEHVGTADVRDGTQTASSSLGEVFWDQSQLKVGDMSIYRRWDKSTQTSNYEEKTTWTYKGHAQLYLGVNKDNPKEHLWIEMTRYTSNSAPLGQVNGIRIMSYEDYGKKKNAVFIRLSDRIPKTRVTWYQISPSWMLIPQEGEV